MIDNHKQCVFCKALLFEDDDVVYCPVCGAPHHHECYNSCGHCALEQYHGTKNEYNPHPENKEEKQEGIPLNREGHACRRCGKVSSMDTIFCPYCGTLFSDGKNQTSASADIDAGSPYSIAIDLLGGIDKNAKIDDIEVMEIASFVRVNTRRYIPLFASMTEHKNKRGWNWSAFIFPAAWNAYRKNYIAAGVFMALLFSALCLVSSLVFALNSYVGTLPVDAALTTSVLADAFSSVSLLHWLLFGVGLIIDFLSRIVSALYGDYWYKTRAFEKINEIKSDDEVEDVTQELQIKGGVNQWLGMLTLYPSVLLLYQCATLLMQIFSWFMSGGMM